MAKLDILLLGSYGQSNLGDDALLFSYLKFLTKRFGNKINSIYVNTNNKANIPDFIVNEFKNINFFETYNGSFFKKIKIFTKSDIILFGGGSLIKELNRNTSRNKYSTLVNLLLLTTFFRFLNKKIVALNIGIGPLKTKLGRVLARLIIYNLSYIITRDNTSYLEARKLSNKPKRIIDSSDGVFLIDWNKYSSSKIDRKKSKFIGLNFNFNVDDKVPIDLYRKNVIGLINAITKKYPNYNIIFFPFQTKFDINNDLAFFKKSILTNIKDKKRIKIIENLNLENLINNLNKLRCFIGTRYHSIIFCIISKTPFYNIAYDVKCESILKELGFENNSRVDDINFNEIFRFIENTSKKEILDKNYSYCYSKINKNFKNIDWL
ncbi:polysaccharide pyruvyl transferase family protein [Candidatus Woesearchaeota archaeon]|nr:polysaccharide pyruvyl transferase family protein [Candidatus Woesearchaeota archaeon]